MPEQSQNRIISLEQLNGDIYRMTVESEYIASNSEPGQFVNIKCGEGAQPLLRRPLSISGADTENGRYELIFGVRGTGTGLLARKRPGDLLDVLGPLGNHFDLDAKYRRIAVVGGGLGIFPLLFLLNKSGAEVKKAYLGFRSASCAVLEKEFRRASDSLEIATDDGSRGEKGFVTDLIIRDMNAGQYDMIYICGPAPMMRKIAEAANAKGIGCQVSMEERMGCGFGACFACVCKTRRDGGGWQYSHVCKDGPVFSGSDIYGGRDTEVKSEGNS